jgi:hypothetical protein
MKKALEAGIATREKIVGAIMEVAEISNRAYELANIMLSALDDEPDKPEPQGSVVVDWEEFKRIGSRYTNGLEVACLLETLKSQWLHTKPAIDPEIKRVYELGRYIKRNTNDFHKEFNDTMWKCIKAHVENGGM